MFYQFIVLLIAAAASAPFYAQQYAANEEFG
jgi:hypothetical protein